MLGKHIPLRYLSPVFTIFTKGSHKVAQAGLELTA